MKTRIKNAAIFYGFYVIFILASWLIWDDLPRRFMHAFIVGSIWGVLLALSNFDRLANTYNRESMFDHSIFDKKAWQELETRNPLYLFIIFFILPSLVTFYELMRLIKKIPKKVEG